MGIIKVFCKKKPPVQSFFDAKMKIRSFAYGKEVQKEFTEWQEYFTDRRRMFPSGFVLSEQQDIFGETYEKYVETQSLDKALAPLMIDGAKLELREDRYVWINGKRSALHAGTEIKAGAAFCFVHNEKQVKGLAIIGKPDGSEETRLSVYKWVKDNLETQPFASVPLPPTFDASSHLTCYGKHVFVIHNSMLDYYYLNVDENELERVAIGGDEPNETQDCCKFVTPVILTNGLGHVFWISENDVYGFPIGYPRRLFRIEGTQREKTLHIRGGKKSLYVYRKDKNTSQVTCWRYRLNETGAYSGKAMAADSLTGKKI